MERDLLDVDLAPASTSAATEVGSETWRKLHKRLDDAARRAPEAGAWIEGATAVRSRVVDKSDPVQHDPLCRGQRAVAATERVAQ